MESKRYENDRECPHHRRSHDGSGGVRSRRERVQRPRAARAPRGRRARAPRSHGQPAVRADAAHDRIRSPLVARRGRPPLRRRRQPLPRLVGRLRDVQRRAEQPAGACRAAGSARARHAGEARARRQPAGGDPRRRAAEAGAFEPRARAVLELRDGGSRGGDQDRAGGHRPHRGRLGRARLPRADARRALGVRRPRVLRPLPAARARLLARPVRRPRGAGRCAMR